MSAHPAQGAAHSRHPETCRGSSTTLSRQGDTSLNAMEGVRSTRNMHPPHHPTRPTSILLWYASQKGRHKHARTHSHTLTRAEARRQSTGVACWPAGLTATTCASRCGAIHGQVVVSAHPAQGAGPTWSGDMVGRHDRQDNQVACRLLSSTSNVFTGSHIKPHTAPRHSACS